MWTLSEGNPHLFSICRAMNTQTQTHQSKNVHVREVYAGKLLVGSCWLGVCVELQNKLRLFFSW